MGFAMLNRHRGPEQPPRPPEPTKEELAQRVSELEAELQTLRNQATLTVEIPDDAIVKAMGDATEKIEELSKQLADANAEIEALKDQLALLQKSDAHAVIENVLSAAKAPVTVWVTEPTPVEPEEQTTPDTPSGKAKRGGK